MIAYTCWVCPTKNIMILSFERINCTKYKERYNGDEKDSYWWLCLLSLHPVDWLWLIFFTEIPVQQKTHSEKERSERESYCLNYKKNTLKTELSRTIATKNNIPDI
jgi:hypothetical protein